ncbi:MAG TPA: ferritin-like domain-containing protein [Clostridia bacterium]|nr:ferritin-like domain-containing protein [Clostridia bacterium]
MDYYDWDMNQGMGYGPHYEYQRLFQNPERFLRDLEMAIQGEAEAISFYTALLQMAPDELARRNIRHALEDERKHYRQFSDLYRYLRGRSIQVPIPPPPSIPCYQQALIKAFEDELAAAELYRGMYLNALTMPIRDLMFEIMTDEMEHASRFSLLYAATKEDLEEEED